MKCDDGTLKKHVGISRNALNVRHFNSVFLSFFRVVECMQKIGCPEYLGSDLFGDEDEGFV